MKQFFEVMFFNPKWYHYAVITVLFPISVVYGFIMLFRRVVKTKKRFSVPIVSVGNLIVGGSGKTPFVIKIASIFDGATVISRGYGRESQGLVEVSHNGNVLTNVKQSGDEAMLMAKSLPKASVIVSEDREKAIEKAIANGSKVIILDDGFNRVNIEKYEILLEPEKVFNWLTFPAGPFREFWFSKVFSNIVLKEGRDFVREVSFKDVKSRMMLVTAIANPKRLDSFLPEEVVEKLCLDDHAYFNEDEINSLVKENSIDAIMVTSKDLVKLEELNIDVPIVEMALELTVNDDIIHSIKNYVKERS